jgi:hypothetical protein
MASLTGIRVVSAIGFAISVGVLVLVGWIAPDEGLTGVSLHQAISLAAVFMAAPIAVWLAPKNPQNLVSVGGGWFAAGAATMLGGNTLMAVAIPYGLLIFLFGAGQEPPLTSRLVGRLLLTAGALIVAVIWAHDSGALTGIGALVLAAAVAGSSAFNSVAFRACRGERPRQ